MDEGISELELQGRYPQVKFAGNSRFYDDSVTKSLAATVGDQPIAWVSEELNTRAVARQPRVTLAEKMDRALQAVLVAVTPVIAEKGASDGPK